MNIDLLNRIRRVPALYDAAVAGRDLKSWLAGLVSGRYAQHGEDDFIDRFFARQAKGVYVDIGASHPFRISNTYRLYRRGWRGITVEPIPRLVALHRWWRPRDTILPCAVGPDAGMLRFFEMTPSVLSTLDAETARRYVDQGVAAICREYPIAVITIDDVLRRGAEPTGTIDLLSIDIEGLDFGVLATTDFTRFRPRLVCIEFSGQAEDQRRLTRFFDGVGYAVLERLGCNLLAAPRAELEARATTAA